MTMKSTLEYVITLGFLMTRPIAQLFKPCIKLYTWPSNSNLIGAFRLGKVRVVRYLSDPQIGRRWGKFVSDMFLLGTCSVFLARSLGQSASCKFLLCGRIIFHGTCTSISQFFLNCVFRHRARFRRYATVTWEEHVLSHSTSKDG